MLFHKGRELYGLYEARQAILGHLQQGGNPTPFDRIQATRLARQCVETLIDRAEEGSSAASAIGLREGRVEQLEFAPKDSPFGEGIYVGLQAPPVRLRDVDGALTNFSEVPGIEREGDRLRALTFAKPEPDGSQPVGYGDVEAADRDLDAVATILAGGGARHVIPLLTLRAGLAMWQGRHDVARHAVQRGLTETRSDDLVILAVLVWQGGAVDLVLLAVVGAYHRQFLAVVFDEEFARLRGVPVGFFYLLLLVLVAVTVVLLIQVVGLILVLALLTLPAAVAGHYVHSLGRMMLIATLLGALFLTMGWQTPLWLTNALDLIGQLAIPLMLITLGVAVAHPELSEGVPDLE